MPSAMGIKGPWAQLGHSREEMESQPFLIMVPEVSRVLWGWSKH